MLELVGKDTGRTGADRAAEAEGRRVAARLAGGGLVESALALVACLR
ncbi:hypothetical protein ODS41_05575 [Pyrobaculum sp. 3827-6]|nr:hypothetical protein [Pyrobaculum sp. 3827-6]MCU7787388.1 hypothetical protein [Pyrobaculum sp. 3827-6]